ncbi:MAG: hypothetical protein NZ571_03145 [Anaerolineae bacterium]|nr:hypothetical protein [Anaerolineae bacterium]
MPLLRRFVILGALIACLAVALPSAAQAQPRPNLSVQVYDYTQPASLPTSYAAIFAPATPEPRVRLEVEGNGAVRFSPNGRWIVTVFGADTTGSAKLTYGQIGGAAFEVTSEPTFGILGPIFSPDSAYMSYTLTSFERLRWELVILDLAGNQRMTFVGPLVFDRSDLIGTPAVIGWNADRTRVYLVGYGPHSAETVPFELDLAPYVYGNATPYELPALRPLMARNALRPQMTYFVSDDGTLIAYTFSEPTRVVTNYAGFGDPFAGIGLLDVRTGQNTILLTAPADEAILNVSYATDAKALYYTTARFVQDPSTGVGVPVGVRLFRYDLEARQNSGGNQLTPDPSMSVFSVAVCGETVFYVANQLGSSDYIFYSASLVNLSQPTALLGGQFGVSFGTCVP